MPAQGHAFSATPESSEATAPTGYYGHAAKLATFGNARRDSDGQMADVIFPGSVAFMAWIGRWLDADADGVIDVRVGWDRSGIVKDLPGTEWTSLRTADAPRPMAFVSPGGHPPAIATYRPGDVEPDFEYTFVNDAIRMWTGGGDDTSSLAVYPDGSLLESYVVEAATHLILVPGFRPDGVARPYTTTEASRVDIDRHAAVAPGPVASLYAAAGLDEILHHSPGLSSCPEGCAVSTIPVPGLLARYEQESDDLAHGSAAGRRAEYETGFHAWLDAHAMLADPDGSTFRGNPRPRPLPAVGPDGRAAIPPGGMLVVDVWTGAWRDLSGDGFVGAVGSDPYEGGTRAIGDRYHASAGEFIAQPGAPPAPREGFVAILTPDDTWGGGVLVVDRDTNGVAYGSQYYTAVALGRPPPHGGVVRTGSDPIVIALDLYNGEGAHWTSWAGVIFPEGTRQGGFTLCTSPRVFDLPDGPETAWDCDRVERLAT
ncbi:MAG TPA: hypothetical protein VM889_07560 [Candidatus Thermoplasmatota archaeon]|nr:hypothetical protein [Candidatus Thermoplasmatota archaeon]